ncbi:MAG: anti-sigma factor family protein, partial [Candidatus Binatus sp.]
MAECGEIGMMLGAFEDSELEPNEMQEVAFHLARCESCTGILADYSTLGRDLRSIAAEPALNGFSSAVVARVERLPQPVTTRIARFFRRQTETVGAGMAWTGVAAVAAVATIILMTPYAEQ